MTDSAHTTVARRSILKGLAAVPVAGAVMADADATELLQLIEHHRAAYAAFCEAITHEEEVKKAYKAAHPGPVTVPSLLGGGYGIELGGDECRKHIIAGYESQRERLKHLASVAPDLAEQVRAVMDAKQAENMELCGRVFAEEQERKEAFGLAAAEREYWTTNDAECDAAMAICAYRCRTLGEARYGVA